MSPEYQKFREVGFELEAAEILANFRLILAFLGQKSLNGRSSFMFGCFN